MNTNFVQLEAGDHGADVPQEFSFFRRLDREILVAALGAGDPFSLMLESGLEKLSPDRAYIVELANNKLRVVAQRGLSSIAVHAHHILDLETTLAGRGLKEGKQRVNYNEVERSSCRPIGDTTGSALALPIFMPIAGGSTKAFGVLCVERDDFLSFTDRDVDFCETLAGQAAIAFLITKTIGSMQVVQSIGSDALAGRISPKDVYDRVLTAVLALLDVSRGQVLVYERGILRIVASTRSGDIGQDLSKLSNGRSVCEEYLLAQNGREPLVIHDIQSDAKWSKFYLPLLGETGSLPMASEFVVPLVDRERLLGALNIESPTRNAFSSLDSSLAVSFAAVVTQAIRSANDAARQIRENRQKKADFAFAELSAISARFLHDMGGKIGNARLRLTELKQHIIKYSLPPMGNLYGLDFLESIRNDVASVAAEISVFHERCNPESSRFMVHDVDLLEVIKHALKEARAPVERVDVVSDGECSCIGTSTLTEVFRCLISNAFEADPASGRVQIHVGFEGPEIARVAIADTGPGIPQNLRSRIFSYGFSSKASGMGMGLWYARIYIERLGGSIEIDDTYNEGARFIVRIPRTQFFDN